MQFTKENAEKVMAGTKVQTRRIVKEGEFWDIWHHQVIADYPAKQRVKWSTGKTYAVCPGRGKPSIGRIRLLEIRKEKLQDISEEDARAEGCNEKHLDARGLWVYRSRQDFAVLWDKINKNSNARWATNLSVWVLTFEVVR